MYVYIHTILFMNTYIYIIHVYIHIYHLYIDSIVYDRYATENMLASKPYVNEDRCSIIINISRS